ncbi:MAG: helix-turn-helix domain-containing protein [Desulfovibrionaceae bacterium]
MPASELASDFEHNNSEVATMSIGARIRAIRGALSQEEFARSIDASKTAIGAYERDSSQPGSAVIIAICGLYNVEPKWLLTGEGPMQPGESPAPPNAATPTPGAPTGQCPRCAQLETELRDLAKESRELNKELREQLRAKEELLRQNGDLRVEVEQLKARAAPTPTGEDELSQCA